VAVKPERRSCERFAVPGATVDWESDREPGRSGSECPLGDLSRGGVRFLTPAPPEGGTLLRVALHIPGEPEPVRLRGSVVWRLVSSGQIHNVAIAFEPYSSSPGANQPDALERLVAIEARFLGSPA
jgi:PilZ domain-containing protein